MENYSFGFELELIINLNNTCKNDRIGDVVILLNKHLNEINSNIKFDYIDCHRKDYSKWLIVTDITIRPDEYIGVPFEIISPILNIDNMHDIFKLLFVLNKLNVYVNRTCGFHIHISKDNGFEFNEIKNISRNYILFEDSIDLFHPFSRRDNTYCKSIVNNSEFVKVKSIQRKINWIGHINNLEDLIYLLNPGLTDRFYKLNFKSLKKKKTIEFRQHCGTVNINDIIYWMFFVILFIYRGSLKYEEKILQLNRKQKFLYLFDNFIKIDSIKYHYSKKNKKYKKNMLKNISGNKNNIF